MKLIFWGLIFLFFDFNINIGRSTISFLPTFVGYALIYSGMGRVNGCETYTGARPWATAGIICSAIIWCANCLGILMGTEISFVLSIVSSLLQLVVTYKIARGVRELEEALKYDLYGKSLMTAWIVLLIWIVLVRVVSVLGMEMFALIALVASMVFMVYYVFRFHKSRKAYEDRMSWPEEEE